MGSINPLRNKRNCLYGIATKHSIFDRIPHFFRKYEKTITCSPCTSIYKRIYNVQYTYYATHTHSVFDSKSLVHRISDRILFCNKLGCQYYSSLSELANSEPGASSSDSIDNSSNKSLESSKIAIPLCYEDYWSEKQIRELESSRPDLLVRGTVFVPAFNTSESRLIPADSEHSCLIAGKTDPEDGVKRRESNELKIYGFISRNRAFHGDKVVCIKSRRQKGKAPQDNLKETPGECRVISIINRNPKLYSFVATFNLSDFYDDSMLHIRCQPRDTRWPAFKVDKSSLKSHISESLSSMKPDQKTLCMCRFLHWHEHQLEPTGAITSLLGDVGETNSQMEATMRFHSLDASDFSESVLEDLGELIKRGNETRDLNRVDMNHLFVLSIDPQDAKDLDDALSVEKLLDDKGNVYYRIGIHIADVSHYVKEDSLVDLDARSRATSVYLEHKVYPMLPRQLSEDLCSLLPNRERLCFSVFVEVVECGDGEKIGNDLYIKDVKFKLTKITSKNRLGYDNAKTMLSSCLKMKKADSNLTGYTFESIESLISQLDLQDETKVALVRLYYLSQKLRFYRLKQLGAVHVDIDGSIKCHIPKIEMELPKMRKLANNKAGDPKRHGSVDDDAAGEVAKRPREEPDQQSDQDPVYEMYLNKKRRLDKNFLLRIEKIPKESHELIEEMMLLANTQVAKFLSEKIDLYLLRVHEDTSKDVRSFIEEVLPSNLKNLINSSSLNVTQVLSKCEEYMDPAAFQSLSFSVLQKFKEAFYSPINKNNSSPKDGSSANGNRKINNNVTGTFANGVDGVSKQGSGTNHVDGHAPDSVKGVYEKGFGHQLRRGDDANDDGRDVDYSQDDASNSLYQNEHIDDYVENLKKEYSSDQYKGHWGLALPVYLHFTSPIRRYPDLYTHRMLKNILHKEGKTTSVELLSKICERCNVQKRRAFDAQKEYKNFAFNRYLQFISFIATKIDPTYLKTVSIARAYPSNGGGISSNAVSDSVVASDLGDRREVWGYLYGDACISSIVSTPVATVNSNMGDGEAPNIENGQAIGKTCLVFYIPLLNEQKSISCESLGLVPINIHFQKTKRQKQRVKNSMLDSYYKSKHGGLSYSKDMERARDDQEGKIQGLSAMMKDKRMEFYIYQKVRVLLVPGLKMWTVRFPEIT
ncbi:uncharacterized protein TOT_010000355 [Theileria orientalis strain Shintoku]|uniref:RNB domain-containing protein n=1 Tax=Theileria orientalis strain Shintoku TaxID=869250 RepID=J4C7E3_THEOR|nr:uncharacterized protein TOT_010000355 [Theileria orientalis strain Shintoku]PVC52685.1 hypothetical protein MACL_00000596 [Theileria orientalis]BAM38888.1 uncharacterized protein TOT_010000355 [Theileria orientalis strain Shintoku]|eukprot:XP_009689189.1 uncharacterized protein TOT_010000355 [Theileria orientalis strain Shintoku]